MCVAMGRHLGVHVLHHAEDGRGRAQLHRSIADAGGARTYGEGGGAEGGDGVGGAHGWGRAC